MIYRDINTHTHTHTHTPSCTCIKVRTESFNLKSEDHHFCYNYRILQFNTRYVHNISFYLIFLIKPRERTSILPAE